MHTNDEYMLDKNDLQQIKEIVKETVQESEKRVTSTIIAAVGEMVEQQILPRLDHLEQETKRLREDVNRLESQMVTKEYLDQKLATEFSNFYTRLKREWFSKDVQWKQRVMQILQHANIAKAEDIHELELLIGM